MKKTNIQRDIDSRARIAAKATPRREAKIENVKLKEDAQGQEDLQSADNQMPEVERKPKKRERTPEGDV